MAKGVWDLGYRHGFNQFAMAAEAAARVTAWWDAASTKIQSTDTRKTAGYILYGGRQLLENSQLGLLANQYTVAAGVSAMLGPLLGTAAVRGAQAYAIRPSGADIDGMLNALQEFGPPMIQEAVSALAKQAPHMGGYLAGMLLYEVAETSAIGAVTAGVGAVAKSAKLPLIVARLTDKFGNVGDFAKIPAIIKKLDDVVAAMKSRATVANSGKHYTDFAEESAAILEKAQSGRKFDLYVAKDAARISKIAPDYATKGLHVHLNGIEIKVLPGDGGSVVLKPVFSSQEKIAGPAIKTLQDQIESSAALRRSLYDTATRARDYLGASSDCRSTWQVGGTALSRKSAQKERLGLRHDYRAITHRSFNSKRSHSDWNDTC